MIRGSGPLGLVLAFVLLGSCAFAQPQMGPQPSTPEPPLADGTGAAAAPEKPAEPEPLQPAVYNQSVPLNPEPAPELPTPVVTIQVRGVETAAIGAEVTYRLTVQNRSQAKAHHVLVRCGVPKNASFVKADPMPASEQPELQWQLGTLAAGAVQRIDVVFRPNPEETELRVVGRVQFDHGQVVKTRLAKPSLSVKKRGPTEGVLHDNMTYRIDVVNNGRVPVQGVTVSDQLPDGLEYERDGSTDSVIDVQKNRRTWNVGALRPGEQRTLQFRVVAKAVGTKLRSMTQAGAGKVSDECPFEVTVREAKLTLQLTGPEAQAYVNQPAAFQVVVKNTGSATLNNVRVTCGFPSECRLARASNGSQVFADSVQWIVQKLAAGEGRTLTFHLTAPNAGRRKVTASARADRGLEQTADVLVDFQGIAALHWETEGTPVAAVGKEIKYTVRVTNTGSADAGNVRVTAHLPPEVKFADRADPPFRQRDRTIAFDPVQLPAHRSATYTLTVTADRKGEAHFRFELQADHMRSGVAAHEKTTTISGEAKPAVPNGSNERKT